MSAGASAPSPSFANQLWFDTSTGYLKKRDNANTTWQVLHSLDANGNVTFKPGANDRNIDLRNASDQIVARLRVDSGGDGRVIAEDRNSVQRVMLHAPTTGGGIYLDGDESTGKQVAPLLRFGPFTLTGLTGQTVTLPAGVQALEVAFANVSFSTTANVLVQLGHSGGIQSSGYVSASAALVHNTVAFVVNDGAGYVFQLAIASQQAFGNMQISGLGGNTWAAAHGGFVNNRAIVGGGGINLGAALTQIRLGGGGSTFGGGTFTVFARF